MIRNNDNSIYRRLYADYLNHRRTVRLNSHRELNLHMELYSRDEIYSREKIYYKVKTDTSKYTFFSNSDEICEICTEKFLCCDIMCINSCYHYWCIKCNNKMKKSDCPFCRTSIESNLFFDSKGEKDCFINKPYSIKLFNIIKKDIENFDLEFDLENQIPNQIENQIENQMNELD